MANRLFVVHSSKGGVGKTFVALNLATCLKMETGQRVLLLDATLPFSRDVAAALELVDLRFLFPLLPMVHNIQPRMLESYPLEHASGISVLGFADGQVPEHLWTPETIAGMRELLIRISAAFDFTIVDLGEKFGSFANAILDLSELIILPLDCDYFSLARMADDLALLQENNYSREMLHVVLNKWNDKAAVQPKMLEQRLHRKLSAIIPLDSEMPFRLTGGKTYAGDFPRHPVATAFQRLALQLLQVPVPRSVSSGGQPSNAILADESFDQESYDALKRRIHEQILELLDLKKLDMEVEADFAKRKELEDEVRKRAIEILDRESQSHDRQLRERIIREVIQEALGLGPLEELLADTTVSEIMVNHWDSIYVERKGKLSKAQQRFLSEKQLMGIIERIVSPLGRRIDVSSPMVDARLRDGSRVNAIIPPLAVAGSMLTIRKFSREALGIDELVDYGTLNHQIAEFLQATVVSRRNIIVSGGTGSGKTTLLNILSSFIPEGERIITVEDSAELQLRQSHVLTLESRPPNIEGQGEVSIRELVKNTLRMRPDRIVVGECRSGEALDMLQAMNTGHDGSMTTVHSNSTREALSRLETLVMFAGFDLPSRAIKEQIVGAVDIVVQLSRFKDGSRKITQVSEVIGIEGETITMGDIFVYQQACVDEEGKGTGDFVPTGYVPHCLKNFEDRGINIPREIFWTTT